MASVSYKVPNTLGVRKYDASPNLVKTDESPPDTSFGYATLLNRGDNTFPVRDYNGVKNDIHSQGLFTHDKDIPHQKCDEKSHRDIDPNLLSLLNFGETSEGGFGGLYSDDPSVFAQKDVPGCKDHSSAYGNVSANDISIPEFKRGENAYLEEPSGKKCITSESDINLSDMLSSICFDDDQSNSNNNPKQSNNGSLCLGEFSFDDIVPKKNSREHLNSSSNLSDILSSLCFDEDQFDSNNPIQSRNASLSLDEFNIEDIIPENTIKHLNSSSKDKDCKSSFLNGASNSKPDEGGLHDINIEDLIVDINTKCSNTFSLNDNTSSGFSFFSNSSENPLTFAQMLDDNKNKSQYDSTDVSLLDLYNSLQSSKMGKSESNSSISDEMDEKSNKNIDLNSESSDQDSGICGSEGLFAFESNSSNPDDDLDIDLSTCIKSFEDKPSFKPKLLVIATDVTSPESTPEHLFHDTSIYFLPLKNIVASQTPRMNLQQSLFSKALSCKSKTDPNQLRKVANIKAQLLNQVFGKSMPVKENKPRIETVAYSDKYITQCNSRRVFGQIEVSASPVR